MGILHYNLYFWSCGLHSRISEAELENLEWSSSKQALRLKGTMSIKESQLSFNYIVLAESLRVV